jgi:hypothetical protein
MSFWKDVVGWEGLYRVSDEGQIKSIRNKTRIIAHKNTKTKSGHVSPYVCLSNNGENKHLRVDHIVAEAFHGKPTNMQRVIHIDGDKTNCAANNLKWHCPIFEPKDYASKLIAKYRKKAVSIHRGGFEDRESRKQAMGYALMYETFMEEIRVFRDDIKRKEALLQSAYDLLEENDPVYSSDLLDKIGFELDIDRGNGDE